MCSKKYWLNNSVGICLIASLLAAEESEESLSLVENHLPQFEEIPSTQQDTVREASPIKDRIQLFFMRHPEPFSVEEWLELATIYQEEGQTTKSEESKKRAAELDPRTPEFIIKQADQLLEQGHLDEAFELYKRSLKLLPCDPHCLESLEKIGKKWTQVAENQEKLVDLYQLLNQCHPNNPDTLFYLGRALARTHHWNEAEEVLKQCLSLAPQYSDAAIQLGNLYIWQERWQEAEEQFNRFPDSIEAQEGLARIAFRQQDYVKASRHFQKVVAANPENWSAKKDYARSLSAQRRYKEARDQYADLLLQDPSPRNWAESLAVKSYSNCALRLESNYTDAKEDDPNLHQPVVKDYYFYSALNLLIPIYDVWRLDTKGIYYHQRENDIYPPVGVNYNVFMGGGQLISHYYFAPKWRWDLSARVIRAWGEGTEAFPFENTTRFEPGTNIAYDSGEHLFIADAHVESFIIKNFSITRSQLLRVDFVDGTYLYRPDVYLHPELELFAAELFYHDSLHNRQNIETGAFRFYLPFPKDYLQAIYLFEHGAFKYLNPNYYSYKQQLRHTLGVKLHVDIQSKGYIEVLYEHRWKYTWDLFQPIGDFIFVAPFQYLAANRYTLRTGYRLRDQLVMELEGHYFHETLPYRDWNIRGFITWQF